MSELADFWKSINKEEVYLIKSDTNDIFVEKVINAINNEKDYTGPRLHILKGVQRIIEKEFENDIQRFPYLALKRSRGHATNV